MAVANVTFFSDALGKWSEYNIYLPDEGNAPWPVILQLHGLSENCHSWIRQSSILRKAERYPMAIVFPDAGTSGYTNWKESERFHRQGYEKLVAFEVPNHVRNHFRVVNAPWGIGGHSMGGYGSMRLGLKYANMFASIWSHSGAFHIDEVFDPELVDTANRDDLNVFALAMKLAGKKSKPEIAFDCGIDDERIVHNRALNACLTEHGIAHHYVENPGEHTWNYWDTHIEAALEQHYRVLSKQLPANADHRS